MNPNKHLTIVGQFRLNDNQPEYCFTNQKNPNPAQRIFPLNSAQLFETLRPELCYVPKNTKQIGDTVFNAYQIKTPLQAQQENCPIAAMQTLAVKPDSPFFNIQSDPNQTQYHAIQLEGGRLFEELLTDLNQVARFYQRKFPKALLKLAKEYLLYYANKALNAGSNIAQSAWHNVFLSHPELTTTILKYLTAYPDDADKIQRQFETELKTATAGETHWTQQGDEYRQALSQALEKCRLALESGDDTLTEIANQQSDLRWLINIAGSDYDISDRFEQAAASFAHYYQLFRKHSDNLHRFLRNGPLHSFLFCWLASKYQQHSSGQPQIEASERMYQISVDGPGRIIAESLENWQDTINTIRQRITVDQLSDEQRQSINNPELYQAGSEAVGTNLIKSLETSGNFTRRQLVEQCEELFVETALLVGGAMSDIVDQFNDRFDDYMVLYHAILRQQSGSPDDFKKAMKNATLKAIAPPKLDEITNRVFNEELAGIKDCTAQPVKQAFLKVVTEDTQGEYLNAYLDKQQDIDASSVKLRDTYRIRLMDVDAAGSDNHSSIGIAGVAALHDIPDIKDDSTKSQARRQAQINRLKSQIKTELPFETTLDILDDPISGGEYQIIRDNTVIGRATVDDKSRENTLVTMSGQFNADDIDTVKDAEQIIAVSNTDNASRFTWKRTDYAAVGKALNSALENSDVTFQDIKLHSFDGEIPTAGPYQLQVDGEPVGQITITTTNQHNTVPTISGTVNTDDLDAMVSAEKLTLKKGDQQVDWQAKERKNLLPMVRDYRGLKPKDVAGEELWQQQVKTEQQFEHLVSEALKNQDDLTMRLHTLVLGEYMLAAPKGQVALDTADLSKMSGLLFDLVRRIGNPKVKELFKNRPSPELLTDPNSGLKGINLSRYYPVTESGELNDILQYHYEVCQDLLSLKNYVREIEQLHRVFDWCSNTDIEIKLINQTLEEHVNCTDSNNELLLCSDADQNHQALFVYLTAQSDAQNGLDSLKALMPGETGVLSQFGWDTQLPLFVATDTAKSDAFPVITGQSIALPDFSKLTSGIQHVPLLELCLSLMTTIELGQFGEFSRKSHNLFKKLNNEVDAAGIPEKGQSINDYLKTLWFTHPVLRSNLVFLKWFNLGLQAKKQHQLQALGTGFGSFLNTLFMGKDWQQQAFAELQTLNNTNSLLTDFRVNMVPLLGAEQKKPAQVGGNFPNITDKFGFEIEQKGQKQSWKLEGIDWKDGYLNQV